MKKYKYKCDNSKCNHQFIDDNPSSCPKCRKDDFTILSQVNSNKKYILIAAVILVAVSTLFVFYNISSDTDDGSQKPMKLISIKTYDNYFEIIDSKDFDEISIYVDNINYSREKSKFFPCKSGKFKISVTKGGLSEETLVDFILKGNPYKSACRIKLEVISYFFDNSTCTHIIQTTDDKNALVSLNKNSGFVNKLEWSFEECRNSDIFYIKLRDSENVITQRLENADNCLDPLDFNKDVFVNSFRLYVNDIRNNRDQFIRSYDTYSPRFILLNEEFDLYDLFAKIGTMDSADPFSVKRLKLLSSDIKYDPFSREITLNISR